LANFKHTKAQLKALRAKQHAVREASTDYENPNQVLTHNQWCALNNFSPSTGKRVLANGLCEYVQLSARRIGVTIAANRKYQQRMIRKAG
jgi:hypothetical protein